MGTSASEIYDLMMQKTADYRLLTLFETSESDFEDYLEAWLKFAIVDFYTCEQALSYDCSTKLFSVDLTTENQVILATLMMKHWMIKNVNDITQMNLHVTDRDFKVASEAMNLREKSAYLNTIKEECSQLLSNYEYKNNPWSDWFLQDFSGI
jgi:hypothetical protein